MLKIDRGAWRVTVHRVAKNWIQLKQLSLDAILILGASLVAQMVKRLLQCGRPEFDPWVEKIPWRRKWQPTPVLLPGKFHGWRSLVEYSSWGHKSQT